MSAKDIVMSAAGAAGGKTYVEDVFSTYLYTGTSPTDQVINNGIDLAGKGGMVWIKGRNSASSSVGAVIDTARGRGSNLKTYDTNAASTSPAGYDIVSFNNNGFTVGESYNVLLNNSGLPVNYASWTFRKAPKFFDVVTYTGNGVSTQTINHALTVTPGMVIIKRTDSTSDWVVLHNEGWLKLNTTGAVNAGGWTWNSTSLTVYSSSGYGVNTSGASYVAYFFANDTTTDGLIQCGSFTSNESLTTVTLGWEPQYLLVKRSDSTGDWRMFDTMRGMTANGADQMLYANTSGAEITTNSGLYAPTATGFTAGGNVVAGNYIYMAIRRGPMRTPTDGTKVFSPVYSSASTPRKITTNFPIDLSLYRFNGTPHSTSVNDRLRGFVQGSYSALYTNNTDAEANGTLSSPWISAQYNDGLVDNGWNSTSPAIYWNFQRAPGFFDVVCYTGTGVARTVNHNLGVAPELMIVKKRSGVSSWFVYCKYFNGGVNPEQWYAIMNNTDAAASGVTGLWNDTAPTSTVFTVGDNGNVNGSGATEVAYLFASCPGVSKVGSYTGNGSSQTINCGFTNGARFVLIKRTDSTGDWYVWDTARGIVASNDPHLSLNTADTEVTTDDTIDPDSTGFIVNQVTATNVNVSGGTYIYLAIA